MLVLEIVDDHGLCKTFRQLGDKCEKISGRKSGGRAGRADFISNRLERSDDDEDASNDHHAVAENFYGIAAVDRGDEIIGGLGKSLSGSDGVGKGLHQSWRHSRLWKL